ncbi:MAG: HAD family hydrolase [Ruminococcaceae bacterium]|nr:HAD family hydrolase [Oscillospiraceae bacterium]
MEQGRAARDPWLYKAEYNRRLMQMVTRRRETIRTGAAVAKQYLVAGSRTFLEALQAKGLLLYLASGTDQPDVLEEANILGLDSFFKEIAGAPAGEVRCRKEEIVRRLLHENQIHGEELAVIGDGKVEIGIACEAGAVALCFASHEMDMPGVDARKRSRLIAAGAQAIISDYLALDDVIAWLGL